MPAELIAPALAKIKALLAEIEEVLAAQGRSERLRDGLVVAIAGPPNVGKSTLMNQLARREVAIVSPHAGTTRDVIEVQLDLDGYPVTVIDTAGIRETDDPVEQEGVRRARARAAEADLVLWLADAIAGGDPARRARRRSGWCATRSISDAARSAIGRAGVGAGAAFRDFGEPRRWHAGVDRGPGRFRAGLFWRRRGRPDRPDAAAQTCCRRRRLRCGAALRSSGRARNWRRRNCGRRPIRLGGSGPGRRRGYPGRDLPGVLYREVIFLRFIH